MIGHVVDQLGVKRILNWNVSLPTRTPHMTAPLTVAALPPQCSLLAKMPPITDQGELGSCTAHSAIAPLHVAQVNAKRSPIITPSALFLYYCERDLNGSVGADSGANISDIYTASHLYGVCPENLWPYDISKFKDAPPQAAYDAAKTERAHIFAPVPLTRARIKGCINLGFPVNLGFVVYESFMGPDVARTGIVPMPGAGEKVLGGHAHDIIGYNEGPGDYEGIPAGYYMGRNSWSTAWGDQGYDYFPMGMVENPEIFSDAWMIRLI